jgi:hypothetical protein
MNKYLMIALGFSAILFAACEKETVVSPQPETPAKSKQEMLQQHPWRLTAWQGTVVGSNQEQDLYALLLDACDHDDQYRFKAQGLLEYAMMEDQCDPEDPAMYTGQWVYTAATNKLRFNAFEFVVDAQLTTLNDSVLVLDFEQALMGTNFTHRWTLRKY